MLLLSLLLLLRIGPHSITGTDTGRLKDESRILRSLAPVRYYGSYANMITIQCSETPLFFCTNKESCADSVQKEQDQVIQEIQSRQPGATVVARTYKLVNAIFIKLPRNNTGFASLGAIPGVKHVLTHTLYNLNVQDVVDSQEIPEIRESYCATGQGVKVAVLDTGIDYTHEAFDGPGTIRAHRMAFGTSKTSIENTRRDGLFPTSRVVAGYDFVGDMFNESQPIKPDDDPIDAPRGHGTSVASIITAIAPDVELVAIKVCTRVGCPEVAILQAFEYALDPDGNNSTDDKVDIINLSLATTRFSPSKCIISLAMEEAFQLGVLTVAAFGNQGNAPYSAGSTGTTPHAISIAATGSPRDDTRVIERYSARGPGENNTVKPDVTAPSRILTAKAGSGNEYIRMSGTSFSAPIIAGSAALVKAQCPTCSPFAIKAILMNTAHHNVKATFNSTIIAPVTRMGSGEVRIREALEADFWAYSPDEVNVQPSLTLGLVNAAQDVVIRRHIKVMSLTTDPQMLSIRSVVRYPTNESHGALKIVFVPSELVLGGCPGEAVFQVEFHIVAAKAPNNFMNSGGALGTDPNSLDKNEIDGHLLISSKESGKEIGIPFHMILRKAANVSVSSSTLEDSSGATVVEVENRGAGVAQIDAYELLALSQAQQEKPRIDTGRPVTIRAVGYRTLDVGRPGCSFLLEYAFSLWDRPVNLDSTFVYANIRVENNRYMLMHSGLSSRNVDCRVINIDTEEESCTGFPVDHGTTTGNIVLRACAEDVGITKPRSIRVQFLASASPTEAQDGVFSDSTPFVTISVPNQVLSANSFNLGHEELQSFSVIETDNIYTDDRRRLGLQLITNAYRSADNTGAATSATDVIFLLKENVTPPVPPIDDVHQGFPDAADVSGPVCLWSDEACARKVTDSPTITPIPTFSPSTTPVPTAEPTPRDEEDPTAAPTCFPEEVPRAAVPTAAPTSAPPNSTPMPISFSSRPFFLPFYLGCITPMIMGLLLLLV